MLISCFTFQSCITTLVVSCDRNNSKNHNSDIFEYHTLIWTVQTWFWDWFIWNFLNLTIRNFILNLILLYPFCPSGHLCDLWPSHSWFMLFFAVCVSGFRWRLHPARRPSTRRRGGRRGAGADPGWRSTSLCLLLSDLWLHARGGRQGNGCGRGGGGREGGGGEDTGESGGEHGLPPQETSSVVGGVEAQPLQPGWRSRGGEGVTGAERFLQMFQIKSQTEKWRILKLMNPLCEQVGSGSHLCKSKQVVQDGEKGNDMKQRSNQGRCAYLGRVLTTRTLPLNPLEDFKK